MGLLITVVMPSEYTVDPIGVGRILGLQQMGELKIALANEALSETQSPAAPAIIPAAAKPVASAAEPRSTPASSAPAPAQKTNKITVNLKPGEGAEIKLDMIEGAKVR